MKIFYALCAVIVLFFVWLGVQMFAPMFGNKDLLDTVYRYDRAIISMPDGSVVKGKVEKWNDYEGDSVQVEIGDKVYLTHYENVVLISE